MAEMSLSEYNAQPRQAPKKQLVIPRSGLVIGGFILVAIVSFFGGTQYQKGKAPTPTDTQTASNNQYSPGGSSGGFNGGSGGFQRGNRVIGTVSAVDSSSITIQSRSGSTNTYTITGNTMVTDNGQASNVSDIQTGATVFLTLDSSNTQDVSGIMLNPSFGGFGPGAGAGGSGATSPDATGTSATGV